MFRARAGTASAAVIRALAGHAATTRSRLARGPRPEAVRSNVVALGRERGRRESGGQRLWCTCNQLLPSRSCSVGCFRFFPSIEGERGGRGPRRSSAFFHSGGPEPPHSDGFSRGTRRVLGEVFEALLRTSGCPRSRYRGRGALPECAARDRVIPGPSYSASAPERLRSTPSMKRNEGEYGTGLAGVDKLGSGGWRIASSQ